MEISEKALHEQRIRHLLTRYPDVTPDEAREITTFVKRSSALDIALFEMDGEVKPMLIRFKRDHRDTFGIGPRQVLVLAVAGLLLLFACYLMWDFGVSR